MMKKMFIAILLVFSIAYSEGDMCIYEKFDIVPPPKIIKYHSNPTNGSLNFKTCAGYGPDFVYSMKPEKLTAKTSSIVIDMIVPILTDVVGGFAEVDVTFHDDQPPVIFSTGFDCDTFEESGMKCPLPFKKGDWVEAKVKCDTRFYIPNIKWSIKISVTNHVNEMVTCVAGTFRAF